MLSEEQGVKGRAGALMSMAVTRTEAELAYKAFDNRKRLE
jgi:hypothetical protein